jgi:hypothetical protein
MTLLLRHCVFLYSATSPSRYYRMSTRICHRRTDIQSDPVIGQARRILIK